MGREAEQSTRPGLDGASRGGRWRRARISRPSIGEKKWISRPSISHLRHLVSVSERTGRRRSVRINGSGLLLLLFLLPSRGIAATTPARVPLQGHLRRAQGTRHPALVADAALRTPLAHPLRLLLLLLPPGGSLFRPGRHLLLTLHHPGLLQLPVGGRRRRRGPR
jgi:hypothetical protein